MMNYALKENDYDDYYTLFFFEKISQQKNRVAVF